MKSKTVPHMHTPLKVTFDGMGLNDANDPYRERMATVTPKYRDQGKRIELVVNAHDELIALLRFLVSLDDDDIDNLDSIKARAKEIIAEERG